MLECESAAKQLPLLDYEAFLSSNDHAERMQVQGLHRCIRQAVVRHCHCPTFLAARQMGLLTKVQAMLHTVGLEAPSMAAAQGWLGRTTASHAGHNAWQ